jgi:glycerol-3-phosphate cytidylyltransferase
MYERSEDKRIGIIAGNFDVIHPGYIKMFNDAKQSACDYFVIALHEDPSLERPQKMKPVLSVAERTEILLSLTSVDEVVYYKTEADLVEVLKKVKPDVRILGSDYEGRDDFTGSELNIQIYYHKRNHEWSTTRFKNEITNQVLSQRKRQEVDDHS